MTGAPSVVSSDQASAKDPGCYCLQGGWAFLNGSTCVCIHLPSSITLGSRLASVSPTFLICEDMGLVTSTPGWVVVRRHEAWGARPCHGTGYSTAASQSSFPGGVTPYLLLPWSLQSPPFFQDMSLCAELPRLL